MIKHTTLWEIIVKEFDPIQFLFMGGIHTARKVRGTTSGRPISEKEKQDCLHDAEAADTLCRKVGLTQSRPAIERIKKCLQGAHINLSDVINLMDELEHRMTDEMKSRKFFSVEPDKQYLLDEKNPLGIKVADAFPSVNVDIEEAAKCLAFERWTAAVFHLSRVAEIAMVNIGKQVGYESHKEGFGEVLRYMDARLEKVRKDFQNASPLFKGDVEFLSAVTVHMHAVNQAWRQRVAHLDKKYTEEEALRIWYATKGLMEQISEKLTEDKTNE